MVFTGIPAMLAGASGDNGGSPAPRSVTDDSNNLIIPEGEVYEMYGCHTYAKNVQVNGIISVKPYDGLDESAGMLWISAGTITVGSSGAVLADGRGYGGGGGGTSTYSNSGGGRGGTGGKGGNGDSGWAGGGGGSNGGMNGGNGAKDGTEAGGGKGGTVYNYGGGDGGKGYGGGGGGGGTEYNGGGGGGGGGSGGKDGSGTTGGDGSGPYPGKGGPGANWASCSDAKNGGYMDKESNGDTTMDLSVAKGSGGGGGGSVNAYYGGGAGGGGAGGGAITLLADTNLSIAGVVTATGAGGGTGGANYNGKAGYGGGGAGGGIALRALKVSFSGVLDARGHDRDKFSTKNGGTIKLFYADALINSGSLQAGRTFINGRPKMKDLVSPPNGLQTFRKPVFKWSPATDPENDPVTYDLEVCSQPSFTPSSRQIYRQGLTETSYQSEKSLSGTGYWHVRGADQIGPGAWSKAWSFKVDDIMPVSHVEALPEFSTSQIFMVSWTGNDNVNGTGLAGFTIMVSDNGGPWTVWQNQTPVTSADFVGFEGHAYSFYSIATDLADNSEGAKVGEALTTIDSVAPTSALEQLPAFETKPGFQVKWKGSDATSGVANYTVFISIDGTDFVPWQDGITDNQADFMGVEGHMYTFYAIARDVAGNVQATPGADRYQTTRVDGTSPSTQFSPGAPHYGDHPVYIKPTTQIYLNGTDNYVGINRTYYTIDTRPQQEYSKFFRETQPGSHNMTYWSLDEASNEEAHRTVWFFVDSEPPVTTLDFIGANYTTELYTYISGQTLIVINGMDRGSGVNRTLYNIDGAGYQVYSAPFKLPKSGSHTLKYMSVDNLGQADAEKNVTLVMDTMGPSTQAIASARISKDPITVEFKAIDLVSGLRDTYYRITRKGDPVMNFQNGSLATVPNNKDGVYTVDYYSADNVGNAEQTRSLQVTIDTAGSLNLTMKGSPTVSDSAFHVRGSVDPGSTVVINGQNVLVRLDGTFDYALDLKEGKNKIVIAATDPAGNTVTQTKYVTYNKPMEAGSLIPILIVVIVVIVVVALIAVMMRKPKVPAPLPGPMMSEVPPAGPPKREATP
jgi:hypothetical protein